MQVKIKLTKERIPSRIYIYAIRCLVNDKRYIGRTGNPTSRVEQHEYMLRSGTHHNKSLQRDYNKYGDENFVFEIIEEGDFGIWDAEKWWMYYFKTYARKHGYNGNDGAFRKKTQYELNAVRDLIMRGIEYGRKQ